MIRRTALSLVVTAALMLLGGGAPMLSAADHVAPFALKDQSGAAFSIAPHEQHTLITFYRGDW